MLHNCLPERSETNRNQFAIRAASQGEDGTEYGSGSGLVEVDAADSGLADLRGSKKLSERSIADEGGIHVVQVVEELRFCRS
jgi:hypothetical protein